MLRLGHALLRLMCGGDSGVLLQDCCLSAQGARECWDLRCFCGCRLPQAHAAGGCKAKPSLSCMLRLSIHPYLQGWTRASTAGNTRQSCGRRRLPAYRYVAWNGDEGLGGRRELPNGKLSSDCAGFLLPLQDYIAESDSLAVLHSQASKGVGKRQCTDGMAAAAAPRSCADRSCAANAPSCVSITVYASVALGQPAFPRKVALRCWAPTCPVHPVPQIKECDGILVQMEDMLGRFQVGAGAQGGCTRCCYTCCCCKLQLLRLLRPQPQPPPQQLQALLLSLLLLLLLTLLLWLRFCCRRRRRCCSAVQHVLVWDCGSQPAC